MPHPRTVPPLIVSVADSMYLDRLSRSRTAPVRTVTRARILTAYVAGASGPAIARDLGVPLPTVMRCVKKAWALGPRRALEELPQAGRPPRITAAARAWILSQACQQPKDLGWAPIAGPRPGSPTTCANTPRRPAIPGRGRSSRGPSRSGWPRRTGTRIGRSTPSSARTPISMTRWCGSCTGTSR